MFGEVFSHGPKLFLLGKCINESVRRTFVAMPSFKDSITTLQASNSLFDNITVGQVMKGKNVGRSKTSGYLWCRPEETVFAAIEKMAAANVGSIIVMNNDAPETANVAGIITERDYMKKVAIAGRSSKEMMCSALMTSAKELQAVSPEDSIRKAMQLMEEKAIRHVPVFSDGNILGIMSVKDVISTILAEHESEVNSMQDYIGGSY